MAFPPLMLHWAQTGVQSPMTLRPGPIPLPREHGAWAMVLTPAVVAVLALGPQPVGLAALLGWLAAYAARGPLEALLGRGASGRAGMASAEPAVARFWLLVLAAVAAALLLPVVLLRPAVLVLLAGALLLELLAFTVWWRPFRLPVLLALVGMHAGIYAAMQISFHFAAIELLLLALPWSRWLDRLLQVQWAARIGRPLLRLAQWCNA